ncbi:MAG: ATP-binding protein [Cyanobacteria bacterium P01_A01_bin.114]
MTAATSSYKADILVIDDTPENLHLLSSMLTEKGYKVRSVTKGITGLRGAQAAPPDLILLDINMPQMNGYEVCEQLKAQPITRDIPVIFISALGDVLDKVKAFSVGGVDFITKPFQVEEVLARIDNHLTIRNLQKQLQQKNQQLQQEIDERRRAEEKFEKAFLASPSPIAITDLTEHRLVEVNPSFLQMSGYTTGEVINQTVTDLRCWLDQGQYDSASRSPIARYNQELEFRTKANTVRTVLLSIEHIALNGKPCALNIINDITERKRLENEFISIVSHELRTPMHSLIGALDLLSSGQLGGLSPQGQQILQMATTNTERLIRLVNDILDLERIRSGTITMQVQPCEIGDLLTQATEAMQTMADKAQVALTVSPVAATLTVDPDRMLQTLTNLLSNAIKFSHPNGTVHLSALVIETAEAIPTVPLTCPYLLIQVADQGRGIPHDKLHSIFERFQQVDASDSRKKGGTGLGLAICRNIVQQHGGQIWVESTLGQGSTFYVALPINSLPAS